MKLIAPLWSDPVGWAEGVAKTKLRLCLSMLLHVVFVSGGILGTHWLMQKLPADSNVNWLVIMPGGFVFALIGIILPATYLYAMHRLLKIVRQGTPNR
jgi:hypothetical protein